jgi:lipopolysaccharide transport system ATP-binding protein
VTGKGGRPKKKGPTEIGALKDVGLEINEGDVVGVIGRNGAGKSTLLKVLSKITEPTSGFAEVRGRVGSLLEVGTGFHNELTGRENIFLNGAILGMRRAEINRKFDEIVAFAEVEQFIDTPVKRYSSGMYLRLAFAVAAHLEPEILLVDEVLAVGDASFQKKCLGKLGDVAKEGRTVLFVSHNMGAVRSMCTHGIVLDQGMVREAGEIGTAVECYYRLIGALEQTAAAAGSEAELRSGFGLVKVDCDGGSTVAQSKGFETSTTLRFAESVSGFDLYCMLEDMYGREVFHLRESNTDLGLPGVAAGTYAVRTRFPPLWLSPGLYALHYKVQIFGTFGSARYVTDKIPLDVEGASGVLSTALLHPGATWEIDRP